MKSDNCSQFRQMTRELLRWMGRQTPNIPYLRAIPNRILKPLHTAMGLKGGVVDVLGFQMCLEPRECVDGNLWFAPHLYDREEFRYIEVRMPLDGVFLDVGANVGFWSLRFSHLFPRSKIFSIEANPATFDILCENIEINAFQNIKPLCIGVSDDNGELPLYCDDSGNRGADSFAEYANERSRSLLVLVKPLYEILVTANVKRIDVMKLDIEGFEGRVLKRFLTEAPRTLWPRFICAEVSHVPQVVSLLQKWGYRRVLSAGENCVFELL